MAAQLSEGQIFALIGVFNAKNVGGTQATSHILYLMTGRVIDPNEIWAISEGLTFEEWSGRSPEDNQDFSGTDDDFQPWGQDSSDDSPDEDFFNY